MTSPIVRTVLLFWLAVSAQAVGAPLQFLMPEVDRPTYAVRTQLSGNQVPTGRIARVEANGHMQDAWEASQGGQPLVGGQTRAGLPLEITISFGWRPRQRVEVTLHWDGPSGSNSVRAEGTGPTSPAGWWDGSWRHYAGVVLEETAGIARFSEPVHLQLTLPADRLHDPEREFRVVRYAPEDTRADNRGYFEVPCQVYDVRNGEVVAGAAYGGGAAANRSTTLKVAFLADVLSFRKSLYLVFYDNAHTPEPRFATDLQVSGSDLARTVENRYFTIVHDRAFGAIRDCRLKSQSARDRWSVSRSDASLVTLPGGPVYSPIGGGGPAGGEWGAPESEVIAGPVFCTLRRAGGTAENPSIRAAVSNTYYADLPYFVVDETVTFMACASLGGLDQGVVQASDAFDVLAYPKPAGGVSECRLSGSARGQEAPARLALDTPWIALVGRTRHFALVQMRLPGPHLQAPGEDAFANNAALRIDASAQGVRFARSVLGLTRAEGMTLGAHFAAGTRFHTRSAYWLGALQNSPEPLAEFKQLEQRLAHPLRVTVRTDTGARSRVTLRLNEIENAP